MSDDRPIGLIAGEGKLPVLTAEGIRASGRRVACVGLRDQYDDALPGVCDDFRSAGIIQLGRWIRTLRRWGCSETVMIGRVKKVRIYDPLYLVRQVPDRRAARLWFGRLRHDKRDDAILGAVADELASEGIILVDSTKYIPEHLADAGVMTSVQPTAAQQADIDFALPIVSRLNDLDVGQSLAVKDRAVIAVEAVEGTDRMIERAGVLCRRKGWTLVKMAGSQDMRFDVPTIGVQTVEKVAAAGGGCIAVETGRVIMADKPQLIEAANKAGVAVVGVTLDGQQ